jgi:hypothetical protein
MRAGFGGFTALGAFGALILICDNPRSRAREKKRRADIFSQQRNQNN